MVTEAAGDAVGAAYGATRAELHLVDALRQGDEAAFTALVRRHHPAMLRVAQMYVSTAATAEEVIQETWIAVLNGLERFEGRSSLRTWIFRILMNVAKTRGGRESRSLPFSSLAGKDSDDWECAVDGDRFLSSDHPLWPGEWAALPRRWAELPEHRLLSRETLDMIRAAIEQLPMSQREVITLRDIEGWGAAEVCALLDLTESNQRVLLHRARSTVRRALEQYFDGD